MADPLSHPIPALADATRRLVRAVDGLADQDYREPSLLPGWTRAHVLAHLALNAEGLARALVGLVEGERLPMYPSQEARDADIAELAEQDPATIRSRTLGGCTDLADAIVAVPDDQGSATIERVPGGARTFTPVDVPWMRWREVEIHHADLAIGYGPADWSTDFAVHVLEAALARGGASGPCRIRATDLDRTWATGDGGPALSGRSTDLAWWSTGRGAGEGLTTDGGELPRMGAW